MHPSQHGVHCGHCLLCWRWHENHAQLRYWQLKEVRSRTENQPTNHFCVFYDVGIVCDCGHLRPSLGQNLRRLNKRVSTVLPSKRIATWLGCKEILRCLVHEFWHMDLAFYKYGADFTAGDPWVGQVFPSTSYLLGCWYLLFRKGHANQSPELELEWGARPNRVHFLWQDRHTHSKRHGL